MIEEKGYGNIMSKEKVGGSVKTEERVVGTVKNEPRAGGTVNSQQMWTTYVMAGEVVAHMNKIYDLETCIKSFEKKD